MVGRVEFDVRVERWLRPRRGGEGDDPPFSLDEAGFLPSDARSDQGELVRPEVAARRGALVLLGEPGAGKTTLFTELTGCSARTAPPLPGRPGTVWVTGSELTDAASVGDLLTDHLVALPDAGGPRESADELVVVIDQLDESPFLRGLSRRLERALAGRDTQGLRVLVACRTAEYPSQLTSVLQRALDKCVIADLAPLRRQDAVDLVASIGMRADEFLDAVVDNDAGVLASVPLTLKVLVAAYQDDPAVLGRGPLALFERGVTALLEEPSPGRASFVETSVGQRLVIASRIAAYLLLCGQRSLLTGPLASARERDVHLGAVSGGRETAGAGPFEVSATRVEETLRTALFSYSGPDRVAFAHSSFAAFLAARYLVARLRAGDRAADRQVSGVFLVSAPDEDSTSIPDYLREVAAWLLAHAPKECRWLAVADPEALMAHSAYITCPDVRAQLVDGLLDRAVSIELTDRSWQRARWRLTHPTFVEQLGTVLEHAVRNPSADLADLARCRLAVRLAQDSGLGALADRLLGLAESPGWPVDLRKSAAIAAMDASITAAVPRLRRLLATPVPETAAVLVDDLHGGQQIDDEVGPDSPRELVGTLLHLLWPDHLTFAEAAPHIQPFRQRVFVGMYRWQTRRFAWSVADDDLSDLLSHAEHVLADLGISLDGRSREFELDEDDEATVSQMRGTRLDRKSLYEFLDPIIGRVLLASDPYRHLPRIARILTWLLRSAASSTMPDAVNLVDADGQELAETTALRRGLAEALVRCFVERTNGFDSYQAFVVTTHWSRTFRSLDDEAAPHGLRRGDRQRILSDDDFPWALERADHHRDAGDTALADAMGLVAATIANLNNRASFELAYTRLGTPEWEHFRGTYEGIWIDSPLARAMRASERQPWGELDAFTTLQNKRLQAAVEGDTTAFWQLVKDLWVNPEAGQYATTSSWELGAFPGAALWPEDYLRSQLRIAAAHYLRAAHDYRATWLGTHTLDYRANAGFVALTILHDADLLDSLPTDRWASWAGTIVENIDRNGRPDSSLRRDLLDRATQHARDEFADAVAQLVRTHLAYGETPCYLADLPFSVVPLLAELAVETHTALLHHTIDDAVEPAAEQRPAINGPVVLLATAAARDAAVSTWANLLRQPLHAGDATAVAEAQRALDRHEHNDADTGIRMAVAAGAALLAADASTHWPAIHSKIITSSEFADQLARTCSSRHYRPPITEELPDSALVQAYRWLAAVCPPNTEIYHPGTRWFTTEDDIHDWRNTILSALSQRGTVDAVREICKLAHGAPDALSIKAALIVARRAQANSTSPLRSQDVTTLLTDTARRVVHTAVQLAQLITDTLDEIAADLHTHSNLLWDSERPPRAKKEKRLKPTWRPKREGSLAAYIAHELTLRLQHRPIIINREVMIKPTGAGDSGQRPDILVTATAPASDRTTDTHQLTVPIEIKGTWHRSVLTAQRNQLAKRYLPASKTDVGVYLVGWYPIEHWDVLNDRGKTIAKKFTHADELRHELADQANAIHIESGSRTFPYVIEVPRAVPESEATP